LKPFTLNQAAQISHKSKAGILKAIHGGRLSAKQNELKIWEIDPAELHRVYPYQLPNEEVTAKLPQEKPPVTTELLAELLAKEKEEREKDRNQYEETINKLWQRLEDEAEERKKLTRLLTHQPEPAKKENLLFKKIFKSKRE
jgi:hypothetical protein